MRSFTVHRSRFTVLVSLCIFLILVSFNNAHATRGYSLTGKVITADTNIPVEDAMVTVAPKEGGKEKKTKTSKDGLFNFKDLPVGYYTIRAKAVGFVETIVADVEVKKGIEPLIVSLGRGGSISGRVVGPDGVPIKDAVIEITGNRGRTTTGENGDFRLNALQDGYYSLFIKAKGYASTYSQQYHVKDGKDLSLPAITLSTGGSISGRVLDEKGNPLKDAEIRASGPSYGSDKTKEDGSFLIDGLRPGEYHLYPNIDGYFLETRRFTVAEGKTEDVGNLSLTLSPPEYHIYLNKQVFTTKQKIRLNYSTYRVNETSYEIYRVDMEGLLKKSGSKGISEILKIEPDVLKQKPVKIWKEEIRYKSRYKKIYGKKVNVPPLNPGAYILIAKPENLEARKIWFLVTDLGLITKESKDEILLYAVNLRDSSPIPDTDISVYSDSGIFKKGKAGNDGIWRNPVIDKELNPLIFARSGNHMAMIRPGDESWGPSRDNYKVYLYTERPVYRPDQEVFFKGIVRKIEDKGYSVQSARDVMVEVKDTNGTSVYRKTLTTNNYGSFNDRIFLSSEPPLGTYTINAEIDGETHSANFRVLEYRKPEYTVSIETDKKRYIKGETIKANISSEYYFGAPVSDARVSYFVYENYRYYDFEEGEFYDQHSGYGASYGRLVTQGEAVTDQGGKASFEVPTKDVKYDSDYTIEARVVDQSRREVTGRHTILVTRGEFDIAIIQERYVYTPKEKIKLTVKALDYDDKAVSTSVLLKVFMEYWNREKRLWERKEIESLRIEKKTDNNGLMDFSFIPDRSGDYKVFAQTMDRMGNIITDERYVWVSGYDYGYEYSRADLKLISDRKGYKYGDTAKVLIQTPMKDATFLMTIEGKNIYEAKIIKVKGNSRLIDIPLKKEYISNVYLSLTSAYKGNFYSRQLNINVSAEERFLNVGVTTDKSEYKPSEKALYKIKTTDKSGRPVSAEVSLGVVDASIYSISKELVPDIKKYFYGMRPNYVITRHSFPRFYEAGASKEETAVHIRKKFKDTAFWLAEIITDEKGEAKAEVELPENLTTWRATAKAHTINTLVGENTQEVIAKKDIIARLETPRFFDEKDELMLTGVIHNYTKETQDFKVGIKADGLKILDELKTERKIESGGTARVDWRALVQKGKEAIVTLYASSKAGSDGMELRIPILPHGMPKAEIKNGEVTGIGVISVTENVRVLRETPLETASLNIFLSPSLVLSLFDSLDYLARYPYGCVEQTMSSFLPDVVLTDILKNIDHNVIPAERYRKLEKELPKMVRKGIDRLYSFQKDNGGWGWWKQDEADPYMTAYVLFGLKKAKDAGYQVDTERINRGINLLKDLYSREKRQDAKIFIAYSLIENGEKIEVGPLYQERNKLSNYSKAILAIVLNRLGEIKKSEDVLKEIDMAHKTINGYIFWPSSGERYSWMDNAVETTSYVLIAYLKIRPGDEKVNKIIRWLMAKKEGDRWDSTKSTSAALTALTEYIRVNKDIYPDMKVRIYLNNEQVWDGRFGKDIKGKESDGKYGKGYQSRIEVPASKLRHGDNTVRIEKEGRGMLYYSSVINYFIEEEPVKSAGRGFRIERDYSLVRYVKNEKGEMERKVEKINGPVRSGDEIEVRLKITADESYRYIIIEDPIPSGAEIVQRTGDIESGWHYWYSHEEFRDEKAVFFAHTWWERTYDISYTIRAEVPGDYHIMPTRVSSMYFPEINGSGDEARMRIVP